MSYNVTSAANMIFTPVPAEAPSTFDLGLSGTADYVDHVLHQITLLGVEILFGEGTDLFDLTEANYTTVQGYIQSCGYTLQVKANDTTTDPWTLYTSGTTELFDIWMDFQAI